MHAGCEQETQRRRCSSTTDVAKSNLSNTENEDADTLLKPLFPSGRIALASSSTLLYSTPPKPSLESFQSSSSTALNTYSLRRPRTSQVEPGECLVETHLHQPGHTHRTNSMNRHETGQKYLTITNSTVSRSSIDLFDEDSINDFDDAEGVILIIRLSVVSVQLCSKFSIDFCIQQFSFALKKVDQFDKCCFVSSRFAARCLNGKASCSHLNRFCAQQCKPTLALVSIQMVTKIHRRIVELTFSHFGASIQGSC
ncbi:N-acetylgalactosamine kinase [Trichinella spiralis]|uniref:N-acetylgalactosamine kinase n=1 Tax=Trichinella spiralis TaxID=6334 RepID=UPI0001EFD743|nr:N-acetylgalactosamine kinase [Trichinella spiralis]